ncbi:hypothetical protein PPL_01611 [Heterostelium album PN500]|uniref:Uncharacterized protein n=1 Tax=Heterostelium pallidum (strain ATCC 26659 / Pp 5 / PN500) TaxID=670386 RepID=D3AZZ7_HETP5|nr:hypothetical protein PPL_01611 [Heterostelium album PN500]EFA84621.1 hypothetical protein PPL_01611 [Heterostelium album PN500]|eukprot:XP_020436734.1 hypothetical protein PPL_01611 [Heterostelium album PN500]
MDQERLYRNFQLILKNKQLFKYIIKVGRPLHSTNLLYDQIVNRNWMLEHGYLSLLWYKINRDDHSRFFDIDSTGTTIIEHGDNQLFDTYFDSISRDRLFPPSLKNYFLEHAIKYNNHIAKRIIDHHLELDVDKFINRALALVNPEIALYILEKFRKRPVYFRECYGSSEHDQHLLKVEFHKHFSCNRYLQFISFLEEHELIAKAESTCLCTLLLLAGDQSITKRHLDAYPKLLISSFILQALNYIKMTLLQETSQSLTESLESIQFALGIFDSGAYSKTLLRMAEEKVNSFTKISRDDRIRIILFDLYCGLADAYTTYNESYFVFRDIVSLIKIVIAIDDNEDPDPEVKFRSVFHMERYRLFNEFYYNQLRPIQNSDLEMVQFFLENITNRSDLRDNCHSILLTSIIEALTPIIEYIFKKYYDLFAEIQLEVVIKDSGRLDIGYYAYLLDISQIDIATKTIIEQIYLMSHSFEIIKCLMNPKTNLKIIRALSTLFPGQEIKMNNVISTMLLIPMKL